MCPPFSALSSPSKNSRAALNKPCCFATVQNPYEIGLPIKKHPAHVGPHAHTSTNGPNATKWNLSFAPCSLTSSQERSMWEDLPFDLLSHIFSFLPPSSLACCTSACRHWRNTALTAAAPSPSRHPPWLLAVPARTQSQSPCFAYNPSLRRWHSLPLSFLPFPVRLITPIRTLLLCKLAASPALRLLLCNPFTRQFKLLPRLIHSRTNPAVGTVIDDDGFRVLVAGGASGASYERAVEVYDTRTGEWAAAGAMPPEFAVRLTVWTPSESVYGGDGVLYWMTSARAYSVVGFDVRGGEWREVKVPLAERLEWAALVGRGSGRVGLVGGGGGGEGGGWVWELGEAGEWVAVGLVPPVKMQGSIKCVGGGQGEVVYLFGDLASRILVGDLRGSRSSIAEWFWIEGCCYAVPETPIKAVLMHPSLSPF